MPDLFERPFSVINIANMLGFGLASISFNKKNEGGFIRLLEL